jgi:uncharacterized protein involved in response to NO
MDRHETEPAMPPAILRLFSEGHRVFMLSAGLWAVFAMVIWTGWIGIHAAGGMVSDMPFAPAPHLWHAHELVFGYASAAMGGFFLTAVPNWTGAKAARHAFIAVVAAIWLAGRLALWVSASLPPLLVAAVDLAFLPVLAARILTQLLHRPKPQNMMFLVILALIWTGNLLVHLEWSGWGGDVAAGLRLGLLGTCAMIAILGGRVTPAFTRNAMQRDGKVDNLPQDRPPLALAAAGLTLALAVLAGAGSAIPVPPALSGAVALLAAATLWLRQASWRPLWTRGQPILWVLHLGYATLGLGYALTGLATLGIGSEVAALHVLGIGAVGGMTLAVMSRATLGHGGRPLVAPRPVALAYGLIFLAAGLRWLGSSLGLAAYYPSVLAAGFLWICAFALFVAGLWGAFWGARPARAPVPPPPDKRGADRSRMSQSSV